MNASKCMEEECERTHARARTHTHTHMKGINPSESPVPSLWSGSRLAKPLWWSRRHAQNPRGASAQRRVQRHFPFSLKSARRGSLLWARSRTTKIITFTTSAESAAVRHAANVSWPTALIRQGISDALWSMSAWEPLQEGLYPTGGTTHDTLVCPYAYITSCNFNSIGLSNHLIYQ